MNVLKVIPTSRTLKITNVLVYNITGVELLQRLRTEHCEANDPKVIKENVEKASSERNELWGSMFGISKNTKITDQNESEFKTQYNPGTSKFDQKSFLSLFSDGLTAAEYFNPSASNKNDVGRPQVVKERRQNFKGQTWNTEESPISLKEQLIPIFDILCNFNGLAPFSVYFRSTSGPLPVKDLISEPKKIYHGLNHFVKC